MSTSESNKDRLFRVFKFSKTLLIPDTLELTTLKFIETKPWSLAPHFFWPTMLSMSAVPEENTKQFSNMSMQLTADNRTPTIKSGCLQTIN